MPSTETNSESTLTNADIDLVASSMVLEMTVTNADGMTESIEIVNDTEGKPTSKTVKNYVGTLCYYKSGNTQDLYRFYALQTPNTADLEVIDRVAPKVVTMVVLLGSDMSGLYRFPRIGEKVLVLYNSASNTAYMMGYVPGAVNQTFYPSTATPNTDDNIDGLPGGFYAKQKNPGNTDDFLKAHGMAFRYKREKLDGSVDSVNTTTKYTGGVVDTSSTDAVEKTAGTGNYSEIGFYQKKAKWPKAEDKTKYSNQDTINIQSTGDIETRAENYQILRAKRFEILVNTPELSPRQREKNANSGQWNSAQAPVGDSPLDDPMIHNGDLHIRAGRNITIKADNEIKLQVGRTVVTISDGGFSVVTQKTNSGVSLSYDTTFSMNPRSGISMAGQKVNINGTNGVALGDSWGAGVTTTVGVLNINGRSIKLSTMDTFSSLFMLAANSVEWLQNTIQGSRIFNMSPNAQEFLSKQIWGYTLAETIIRDVEPIVSHITKIIDSHGMQDAVNGVEGPPDSLVNSPKIDFLRLDAEPLETFVLCLNMVLNLTNMAYIAVETAEAKKWRKDLQELSDGKKTTLSNPPAKKSRWRDNLNLCASAVDMGIITTVLDVVTAVCMVVGIPGASGEILIRPSGDVVIKAAETLDLYGIKSTSSADLSALPKAILKVGKATAAAAKLGTDVAKLVASHGATYNRVKPWLEGL